MFWGQQQKPIDFVVSVSLGSISRALGQLGIIIILIISWDCALRYFCILMSLRTCPKTDTFSTDLFARNIAWISDHNNNTAFVIIRKYRGYYHATYHFGDVLLVYNESLSLFLSTLKGRSLSQVSLMGYLAQEKTCVIDNTRK